MPKRRRIEVAATDGTASKSVTRGASQPQHSKKAADGPSTQAERDPADQQSEKHKRGKQPESDTANGKNTIDATTLQRQGKAKQKISKATDIDDIFQKGKGSKAKTSAAAEEPPQKVQPKKEKIKGSKNDIFGTGPEKTRRYDEEGLPIYTTEELKVGAGGDTDKCPFDCECCF